MSGDDYKVVLFRNEPSGWVTEFLSIPGCHALMPTREAALAELAAVFQIVVDECAERTQMLPADSTEILRAWCPGGRISPLGYRARMNGRPD